MKALNSTPARRKAGGLTDNIKTFVYAILIALAIRTVAFEPFNIPSGSMIPTLLVGDYLFVSKYSYGYSRYSLPLGLPLIPGRILVTPPKRGDVAVFKYPPDNKTDYIKRIIGLPGDTVEIVDGTVLVNGQNLDEPYVPPEYRDHVSIAKEVVPKDHYFVLGDHRSSSNDSRVWGFVDRKEIYGKAVFVYWPPDKIGRVR